MVGLFIGFLTKGLDFGNFWPRKVLRAPKGIPSFVVIFWMIGVI